MHQATSEHTLFVHTTRIYNTLQQHVNAFKRWSPPFRHVIYASPIHLRTAVIDTCILNSKCVFLQYDQELGEAIELEYLRFMPFMNKALARLVQEEYPNYANDADDQVSNACPCPPSIPLPQIKASNEDERFEG